MTVLVALIYGPKALPETPPVATSICEVARHPEQFIGRRVSTDARIESDGMHFTILVDNREKGCPRGLVLTTDSGNQQSLDAMKKVSEALSQGHPGTLDKEITGHFVGVVSVGKPEDFMMPSGTRVFVLTLESVQNLRVSEVR